MSQFSRRQLSDYAVTTLLRGDTAVIQRLAAYLIATRRTREAGLIATDIEKALLKSGEVVAHIRSAHPLNDTERANVEALLSSRYSGRIHIGTSVDKDLLGGVVVQTATEEFDGSLRRSIKRLKAMKV